MYLIRLDDASSDWNKANWHRMHDLLSKYHVFPMVAIIPHNEDEFLKQYDADNTFWAVIIDWISEGWIPALHGYNHKQEYASGGINPVNLRSEFASAPIKVQKQKIRDGLCILREKGIIPSIFVAPAHTYDENTVSVLKNETDIRIISDTIASDVYQEDGFTYLPVQIGSPRVLPLRFVTICLHPNTMSDRGFEELEQYLIKNSSNMINLNTYHIINRKKAFYDKALRHLYFVMRSIKHRVK